MVLPTAVIKYAGILTRTAQIIFFPVTLCFENNRVPLGLHMDVANTVVLYYYYYYYYYYYCRLYFTNFHNYSEVILLKC